MFPRRFTGERINPACHSGNDLWLVRIVVEDEAGMLRIAPEMPQSRGCVVLAANMPGNALELAEQHAASIHLLITDVVPPEMNGQDLVGRILSLHPDMKQRVMSGYTLILFPIAVCSTRVSIVSRSRFRPKTLSRQ